MSHMLETIEMEAERREKFDKGAAELLKRSREYYENTERLLCCTTIGTKSWSTASVNLRAAMASLEACSK